MAKFLIQPHVRLHEWVAEEKGFFRDEGLEYEFDAHGFAAASITTSSVKPADAAPVEARSGAFEDMEKGRSCDVSGACHWAVNAAASTSHGRMWGKAYSDLHLGDLRGARIGLPATRGSRRRGGRRRLPLGQPLLGDPGPRAVPGPGRDSAVVRRLPVRPGPAHARPRDPGGKRVGSSVLPARAVGIPQARRHHFHDGLSRERGQPSPTTSSATSGRCAGRRPNSTSSPSRTSATGSERCPTTWARRPTCGGSDRANGSCSSPTRARCSIGPTAGWSAGSSRPQSDRGMTRRF